MCFVLKCFFFKEICCKNGFSGVNNENIGRFVCFGYWVELVI